MELYILDFIFYFCQSIKDSSRQSASYSVYSIVQMEENWNYHYYYKNRKKKSFTPPEDYLFIILSSFTIHFITYNANDLNSSDLKSDEGR